jgi:hypothetical protein
MMPSPPNPIGSVVRRYAHAWAAINDVTTVTDGLSAGQSLRPKYVPRQPSCTSQLQLSAGAVGE